MNLSGTEIQDSSRAGTKIAPVSNSPDFVTSPRRHLGSHFHGETLRRSSPIHPGRQGPFGELLVQSLTLPRS